MKWVRADRVAAISTTVTVVIAVVLQFSYSSIPGLPALIPLRLQDIVYWSLTLFIGAFVGLTVAAKRSSILGVVISSVISFVLLLILVLITNTLFGDPNPFNPISLWAWSPYDEVGIGLVIVLHAVIMLIVVKKALGDKQLNNLTA